MSCWSIEDFLLQTNVKVCVINQSMGRILDCFCKGIHLYYGIHAITSARSNYPRFSRQVWTRLNTWVPKTVNKTLSSRSLASDTFSECVRSAMLRKLRGMTGERLRAAILNAVCTFWENRLREIMLCHKVFPSMFKAIYCVFTKQFFLLRKLFLEFFQHKICICLSYRVC